MSRKGKKSKQKQQQNIIQQELSVSDQQKLSTKCQNIFDKQVLSEYENDNYRECIKQCDRILTFYPKNGETLAMKGLCLHCQGQPNDDDDNENNNDDLRMNGLELIRLGLKYNLKSSICWRVCGLAHKSDRDYEAAIACYKKAGVYDKQNSRIFTDLASLQIQLSKFGEFSQTRHQLWLLNQDKLNCIAYCIALYLNKEYTECLTFINDNIINSNNQKLKINDAVELNEIHLLIAKIYIKQEEYQKCLDFLNEKLDKNEIVDKLKGLQLKINILKKLNKFDDATETALNLIDTNPENLNYHNQYLSLKGFKNEMDEMNETDEIDENKERNEVFLSYKNLQEKYPKCNIIKRVLLQFCCDINEFEILLNKYLISKFKKSVMSLYNDIRCLYSNKLKANIIDKLITNYRSELSSNYRFNINDNKLSASPMCLLWVNYFYCLRLIDLYKFDLALNIINDTINIAPTCIDLYALKGKLYKYIGNKLLAFKYLNIARCLDKADRYLNTKCVRYAFRALYIDIGNEIVSLFLKKTEGTASLHGLQVMWYQLHRAEAHYQLKEYGPAIKQYQNVYHHFETFWKNQTDFHRYSYRKCAISSYQQLLEWEYTLRNHPFFLRAAQNAINLWFKIYKLQNKNNYKELEFGSSPQNEMDKKKHLQNDERGWKLIHNKNPLKFVKKWLNHLLPLIHDIKENNFIYIANIKYLLYTKQYKEMIENLKYIKKTNHNHPYFIYNIFIIIDELKKLKQENQELNELNQLLQEYNINFLKLYYEKNDNNFDKLWCVLKCCLFIPEISKNIGYSTIDIIQKIINLQCNPSQCVEIRNQLTMIHNDNDNDNDDNNKLLQIFEKYVESKYPLQLKKENDII